MISEKVKTPDLSVRDFIGSYKKRHRNKYETPFAVSFLVTNRCTLKCQHCFYHDNINKNKEDELGIDDYIKLSNNLDSFFFGLFCGGEPFIRDDFAEIVKLFRKNNKLFFTGTATNGQLTSAILKHTEEICKADRLRPYHLTFSFEGFKDVHDLIRGKGTFDKAFRSWEECKRLAKHYTNLKLTLSTVINSINQHSLEDFFKWSLSVMKPDGINLLLVRQSPRAGQELKKVDPYRFREITNFIQEAQNNGSMGSDRSPLSKFMQTVNDLVGETMLRKSRSFHCHAGVHGAFIDYNGDVNVCEVFPDPAASFDNPYKIGNLRDYGMDFISLWNSDKANSARKLVNNHKACADCTHETEGYLPSLLFTPNKMDYVLRDL